MSKISDIREFLATCPVLNTIAANIHVDSTDETPVSYGIMPSGESIVERKHTVTGDIITKKQYNLVIYARFLTPEDVNRLENCNVLEELEDWLEEQEALGNVPQFGDDEFSDEEYITAQNGVLFEMADDGLSGLYQIQLAKIYKKRRIVNGKN